MDIIALMMAVSQHATPLSWYTDRGEADQQITEGQFIMK